ncbi:MAG TPA: hypothetical protein VH143_24240 [Kofleriaceae bacterium]|jgi:hypothetical protein|nr:hypothetical protein [Kofleriaceae bacterium]
MADLHELRAAYSRRDPGADAIRRELARTIGDGVAYYELLCLVAEQAWLGGEHCRAESLLRRAALIADSLDHDPRGAARRLTTWIADGLRCDPLLASSAIATYTVIDVELTCALMRFDHATLDHVPMMCLDDRWLLVTAIASGGGKLSARCAVVVDAIMAHHNRGLAAGAPYDPNFIGIKRVEARLVGGDDVAALAPRLRRSAWSPSPLYAIEGARFAPLTAAQLHALLGN